jgi:16S rRNA (uracil1498-N3)-methyltransferase
MRAGIVHTDRRFLVPDLGTAGQTAVLAGGDAHHLTRVLRLGPGDCVSVFDGRGRERLAEVSSAARSTVTLTLLDPIQPAAEARVPFTVAQAVLKGPAMDHAVRDAVMIGAARIQPLLSSHVAVKESVVCRSGALERWRRIALASTRQSRRAVLPAVGEPRSLLDWLASANDELTLILVEPARKAGVVSFRDLLSQPRPASVALIVGPEGGWAQEEVDAAVAVGCTAVTLGALTLRAESVALAAGCLLRFLWED